MADGCYEGDPCWNFWILNLFALGGTESVLSLILLHGDLVQFSRSMGSWQFLVSRLRRHDLWVLWRWSVLKFSDSESFCTWGSKKCFIPNLSTWGFGATFEIYGKLTSTSEPTSCLFIIGVVVMDNGPGANFIRTWCVWGYFVLRR